MRIYHFTAEHLLPSIMTQGLCRGMIPTAIGRTLYVMPGYQWLTQDPEFRRQTWNTRTLIPYDRAAVRLTVEIPESHESQLIRWIDKAHELSGLADELNRYGNPENWWVYNGYIPPAWIQHQEHKFHVKPHRGEEVRVLEVNGRPVSRG